MIESPAGFRSSHHLPFTNGVTAMVYNREAGLIDGFYGHIYRETSKGEKTLNLCERIAVGVRAGGRAGWLSDLDPGTAGYLPGTGIVETRHQVGDLVVTGHFFAPQDSDEKLLAILVGLENVGSQAILDAAIYIYLALRVGGGERRTGHGWVEYHPSSGLMLAGSADTSHTVFGRAVRPRGAQVRFSSASGPELWNRLSRLSELRGGSEVWVGEDLHGVYQGSLGPIEAGQQRCAGVILGYGTNIGPEKARSIMDGFVDGQTAEELLEKENTWWTGWRGRGAAVPDGLFPELHHQARAVLKMSQCRESGAARGQILASLPPGHWNIAWVRDSAYSIAALSAWGHYEEARDGLAFMLDADAGYYREYLWQGLDYGVGMPYRISVCRYFGDGVEESDGETPNIELDGFGLFLWALWYYWESSKDNEFVKRHWTVVGSGVIDPLIAAVDRRGIIRPESGPWETHLPGSSFAYTSICAACGLDRAARISGALGEEAVSGRLMKVSSNLMSAVEKQFTGSGGVLLGKPPQEAGFHLDASVMEAVNFGLVRKDAHWIKPTIEALFHHLQVAPGRGLCRNNDPGEYNEQEWVFIDLRVAEALIRLGRWNEAGSILRWVIGQTKANGNLFAELYRRDNGRYDGAMPMCGFGAGAYLLLERTLEEMGLTMSEVLNS